MTTQTHRKKAHSCQRITAGTASWRAGTSNPRPSPPRWARRPGSLALTSSSSAQTPSRGHHHQGSSAAAASGPRGARHAPRAENPRVKPEMTRHKKPGLYGEERGEGSNRVTVTYLPQRPGGARGPGEGTGDGGEAHGGDGAQGIGRGGREGSSS